MTELSVKVMSWVWESSRSKKSDRLVLLAIADCASEDGSNAYPSITELTRKTGLSERAVQVSLSRLVESGELFVGRNTGPKGCNRYRVIMTAPTDPAGCSPCTPAESAPPPPQTVHPTPAESAPGTVLEPSIEPSVEQQLSVVAERDDVERLCRHLADRVEANGSLRPTITDKWRDAARLMMDKDGRSEAQIHKAIDWCQGDEFWRANIRSMPKLRIQYDQLRLRAMAQANRTNPRPVSDSRIANLQALKSGNRRAVTA